MKLFVLGLDSMPPKYFYDKAEELFPSIAPYIKASARWRMKSCYPPITVPAWMVMFTGKTPGELGVYGFRHRKPGSFDYYIVDSRYFKAKALWDVAAELGKRSALFGVPPTYPPKPIYGYLVTDFTTPSAASNWAYPPTLRMELERRVGKPVFDIKYKSFDKPAVKKDLLEMLDNHLKIVEYIMKNKKWDLFIHVEISVDRAHHAFLKYFEKEHPRYEENEELNVIPEVYKRIDEWFSKMLEGPLKDAVVVFLSDHGIKPLKGTFAINEWLREKGFLALKREPRPGEGLTEDMVDWSKTYAWAWGGYYSRVFVNLEGREKHGVVKPEDYEAVVEDLRRELKAVRGPQGEPWENEVYKPEELYPAVRGDAPDLMAFFDNLNWKPIATLGYDSLYLDRDDRGADDAVHDWYGITAVYDPEGRYSGEKGIIKAEEVFALLKDLLREA
ncbi:MAG: nucleotide pyrophosphatase [Crenarchaeota archaeon]|nr:nucleotide pyrophosphatase [Thermoproteota archaeon]